MINREVVYDPTEEQLLRIDVARALEQLTPEQRQALELALAEYGVRAIARELGLTIPQTQLLLNSAIDAMREMLAGWAHVGHTVEE